MKIDIRKVFVIMARQCMDDKDLLKNSGLPAGTWSQIKSGKCNAKTSSIGKIAQGLGVDVTEIIEY